MATVAGRKPTSKHRPEFATFVRSYVGGDGLQRFEFVIPSKSKPDEVSYAYHVSADGSRPFCACMSVHPYAGPCRLCEPDRAIEMAERAKTILAGLPVPSGY